MSCRIPLENGTRIIIKDETGQCVSQRASNRTREDTEEILRLILEASLREGNADGERTWNLQWEATGRV